MMQILPLIKRRRFRQLEVLESLGVVITISGKRDKVCEAATHPLRSRLNLDRRRRALEPSLPP